MHTETCNACGFVMEFERHPADWPNHPDGVLVVIECPECGAKQNTDGITPLEHVQAQTASIEAEVRAEVARRLGTPVEDVRASDAGSADDRSES